MNEKKHTHGFKIPEDYLDTFEERLFDSMDLDSLPKESPFKVPDAYFDALEDKIVSKAMKQETVKVIPLFQKRLFWYGSSMAACLLVALFFFNRDANFSTIDSSDIEAYVTSDAFSLDSDEIALLLTDEELNELSFEERLFSEETLENYLLDNIDDTTLLIE
jgi:hypothetical protein